jgi:hypothetical protein
VRYFVFFMLYRLSNTRDKVLHSYLDLHAHAHADTLLCLLYILT